MNLLIRPIIIIIGTRPEGIKLVPVYFALKEQGYLVKICATFQHTSLLQEVFDLFGIVPDFSFDIMRENQDLFHITQAVLGACQELFTTQNPKLIIVQGDTTSAMAAALAAFYLKIPIAHVEAGLRTGDILAPYPEEFNRQLISLIAKYHFAPTSVAVNNLKKVGVSAQNIYEVGNTVVDALYLVISLIDSGKLKIKQDILDLIQTPLWIRQAHHERAFSPELLTKDHYKKNSNSVRGELCRIHAGKHKYLFRYDKLKNKSSKLVLLTMHRRESFGENMLRALQAIKDFAQNNPSVDFIYPMHPNPQVLAAVKQVDLQVCSNIKLISALAYHELVYILTQVDCVVSDSGGIQEEAASLGKPVVLLREQTDRPEAVQAGLAWLAGCDPIKITYFLNHALNINKFPAPSRRLGLWRAGYGECHAQLKELSMVYRIQGGVTNIYGDGKSANKIVEILKQDI